jgi:molybdopterin-guanine dinucleotide biosynthesis protein A
MEFDAVVLAGGAASRLDGADKMLVVVDGVRLLDRAVAAVAAARVIVGVGLARPGTETVRWTSETPPGGGPVAALAAGLALVTSSRVVLLAADLPFVRPEHVERLLRALDEPPKPDGVLFVDDQDRDQPLASAWRTAALRQALPPDPAGLGLRRVLGPLTVRRLPGGKDLVDCDTAADVAAARQRPAEPPHRQKPDQRQEHA